MEILNERPDGMSFEDYKEHLKKQKLYIKMKQKHAQVKARTARPEKKALLAKCVRCGKMYVFDPNGDKQLLRNTDDGNLIRICQDCDKQEKTTI